MIRLRLARIKARNVVVWLLRRNIETSLAWFASIQDKQLRDMAEAAKELMDHLPNPIPAAPLNFTESALAEFRGPVSAAGAWIVHVTEKATGNSALAHYETEEMANDAIRDAVLAAPMTLH